jgi:serine/threonine-protein phosphatase CPPED1
MPCLLAVGNHDLGNTPTAQTLERYRRLVGPDYFSFVRRGYAFVVVNAQLWKSPLAGETEKQDVWLEKTLKTAARRHQPIFIVSHYPLFVKDPAEPDAYFNLAPARRDQLLAMFDQCGVVAVLAGHTHTTGIHEYHGIQMVTSENTCRNFDKHPFGFRVWHIGPNQPYAHEFVPLSEDNPGSK